ncbi:MAG: chitobiase/beta-hexosaminidase C-terminal domain-containing protein, partial [Cardiobacterium hominis]
FLPFGELVSANGIGFHTHINWGVAGTSVALALIGIAAAMLMYKKAETPFADKPSGSYAQSFSTILTAVSATAGARLVYTLDGSTPTASSLQAESGTRIAINRVEGSTVTLKVGLLIAGSVSHVVTRRSRFRI